MADANSVSPRLATLGIGGWSTKEPAGGAFNALPTLFGGYYENTVTLHGDSHTVRNGPMLSSKSASLVGYELSDVISGGASVTFGMDGYFCIANALLNWPFRILHNAAVGGETIAQINGRLDAALSKYKPRFALYMGGTNDAQSGSITSIATADAAAASMIAGITAGWSKIKGYGAVVLACTIPPRSNLTGFQRRVWSQVNAWIRQNAARTPGVFLAFDPAVAAGNPTTGNWLASGEYGAIATCNSGDDIHSTTYGYGLIGADGYRRLATLVPLRRQALPSPETAIDVTNGNNPLGNIAGNGKLLGTAGTNASPATGNLPDGWDMQAGVIQAPSGGTIVTSKVQRSILSADATAVDELGEWLQVSMTGGTSEGYCHVRQQTSLLSQGQWAIGDVIRCGLQFETDAANWSQAAVGARHATVIIEFNANGGVGKCGFGVVAGAEVMGRLPAGTVSTPEVRIPEGTTEIWIRIYWRGQGTWRVSDVDCRRQLDRTSSQV